MTLGLLYYTANKLPTSFAEKVREQLKLVMPKGAPLVSVSMAPIEFGDNIVVSPRPPSAENVYRQILVGAKVMTTDLIACCEDDCLYTSAHFELSPPKGEFWYDLNSWRLDPDRFWWRNRTNMSGCICHREDLINTLQDRVDHYNPAKVKSWAEPGKYEAFLGITKVVRRNLKASLPMIHINHEFGINNRRKVKPDDISVTELAPWGPAPALWEKFCGH